MRYAVTFIVVCAVLVWQRSAVLVGGRWLWRRVRADGWGLLLLPLAVLGFGLFGVNGWMFAALVLAVYVLIRAPALAADLAAAALMLLGGYGLLVATAVFRGQLPPGVHTARLYYGVLAGVPDSWQHVLIIPEACLFLAFGLWLAPRTIGAHIPMVNGLGRLVERLAATRTDAVETPGRPGWVYAGPDGGAHPRALSPGLGHAQRMNGVMTGVRRHLSLPGWGVLLVPITLMSWGLWGRSWQTIALVVVAAVLVLFAPTLAADLVSLTLIALGLYGLVMVAFFDSIAMPLGNFLYGAVEVSAVASRPWRDNLIAPQAVLFLVAGLWLVPRTIGVHLRQSRAAAGLAQRVEQLRETRADVVDSAAAELRRVERDLHDGAQARLVALGMNLRAAERLIETSPETALVFVGEAREMSARALTELRDLVRGIHPPVLADRGLADAVRALALETPVPTRLDIDLPGRLPAPVESAAYFAVAEILANAVKHAQAQTVEIQLQHHRGMLRITVTDDGAGGADPEKGSGLRGVERRLGAFDGILAVSSPPGGPTIVVIEVPCASSSLKTSSC